MAGGPRRVVNGLDAEGRSTIVLDDRREIDCPGGQFVWHCPSSPANNSSNEGSGDELFNNSCIYDREGSSFAIFNLKPEEGLLGSGMHATNTIDYIVILKGQIEFHSETDVIELAAGDAFIDRGVLYGWRAVGD